MATIMELAYELYNWVISNIITMLSTSPLELGGGTINTIVNSYVGTALTAIATSVLLIVWLIGLARSISSFDSPSGPSTAFFHMFRLFIPLAMISSYLFIGNLVLSTSSGVVSTLSANAATKLNSVYAVTEEGEVLETEAESSQIQILVDEYLDDANIFMSGIAEATGCLIAMLYLIITVGCCFKLITEVFARFFKLYLIVLVAPIGIAFYGSRETQHMASRYIEALIKAGIQGIVIFLCFVIYAAFHTLGDQFFTLGSDAPLKNLLLFILKGLFYMITLTTLVTSAESITDRLL